ncbi:hypothetical protein C3L33_07915, partial [Rhododendron williamsianum]
MLILNREKELEAFIRIKDCEGSMEGGEDGLMLRLSRFLKENRMDLVSQESLSLRAANAIMSKLGAQLEPFRVVTNETTPWEEKSAVVRLGNKMLKSRRNKQWRKRKRKRIAEMLVKEREQLDQADQEADEWRAREIAKDIAKRKVEKMKEIAKLKAKEEKKRLESELELVLIVEKLQELRSLRIQKLKKQGHFLPEEDDKFLERVRAAVEEEERQATAAADTDAAKGAIATAEESRKSFQGCGPDSKVVTGDEGGNEDGQDKTTESENRRGSGMVTDKESGNQGSEGQSRGGVYDSVASLPIEFYHYYHGSNTDLGTLVEVIPRSRAVVSFRKIQFPKERAIAAIAPKIFEDNIETIQYPLRKVLALYGLEKFGHLEDMSSAGLPVNVLVEVLASKELAVYQDTGFNLQNQQMQYGLPTLCSVNDCLDCFLLVTDMGILPS